MKVLGRGKVIEIQILESQFKDGPGIGQHVAPAIALQDDGQAGLGGTSDTAHLGDIDTPRGQTIERDLTQLIVPDARNESNLVSQGGEIVRHNRRRAAEREHHPAGQKFAVAGKLLRQAIENQI